MNPRDRDHFRQMEVQARKTASHALHPDQCPKLRLHGVDFAIPPRGLRVCPQFDGEGKATLTVDGVEQWPEIEELLPRVGEVTEGATPTMTLDDGDELLCDLMTLARKAAFYENEIDRWHRRTSYGYVLDVRTAAPGSKEGVEISDSDNDGLWTAMYGAGECFEL